MDAPRPYTSAVESSIGEYNEKVSFYAERVRSMGQDVFEAIGIESSSSSS